MTEFWESSFIEKQAMWGFEPADSAILAKDLFIRQGVKSILIPGFGYGRNAKVFLDNGIKVTGIEISKTAIEIYKTEQGSAIKILNGSVTDMPFDQERYDGIFCYALIHLLNKNERAKLIKDCYNQLNPGGYMIFVMISKEAPMFAKGKLISKDRFEIMKGVKMFFYNQDSVQQEFKNYGLTEITAIQEPPKNKEGKIHLPFLIATCQKR